MSEANPTLDPIGYRCDGCGRLFRDPYADLSAIRAAGGRSCCPERKPVGLSDRIEELEAENKLLNEQMAAIEEMGTESLNALPDCLMRLAPALVENDELKVKLAKALEVLEWVKFGGGPRGEGYHELVCTTLAELTGGNDGS